MKLNGDHVYILESVSEAPIVSKGMPAAAVNGLPPTRQINEYGGDENAVLGEIPRVVKGK